MTVVATPDLGAAILIRMRDCTDLVTAIGSSQRIFLEWPKGLVVPDSTGKFLNCLLIETGKGGQGYIGLGLIEERVTLKFYGANRKTANDLYRIGNSYLIQPTERVTSSFRAANCRVNIVEAENQGLRLEDPSASKWPFVEASYIFTYGAIPLS